MEMKNNKSNFRAKLSMILRGYGVVFKNFKKYMIVRAISQAYQTATPYFGIYMTALIVDEVAYSRDLKKLLTLAAVTVVGTLLIGLVGRFLSGRVSVLGSTGNKEERLLFFKAQNRMMYGHIEDPQVTMLQAKVEMDRSTSGGVFMMLATCFFTMLSHIVNIVMSVSITVAMFEIVSDRQLDGFLGFVNSYVSIAVVVLLIAANAIVCAYTSKNQTAKTQEIWHKEAAYNRNMGKYIRINRKDVILFNMRRIFVPIFDEIYKSPKYLDKIFNVKLKYGLWRTVCHHFCTVAIDIYLAAKIFIGAFGIGNFLMYRNTVGRFISAVSGLASNIGLVWQANEYLERAFGFLDLPNDMYQGTLSVEKRDDIEYEVEFRDVSFKYPRSDVWVLRHVSTKFKIGSRLAIVGMNGSGKTTFIKLLCRLYDPTEGKILLNGIDITRYKYDEYMKIFSVVFQDYKLFSFSIAENVAGSLSYDREKVLNCLERAGLGERVSTLERGIETPLYRNYENDGIDISGGEAQKLAIARALYKDAPFIILDEPTAALDPLAEAEVYNQFNKIVENKTAIYISHRLSSCRFCENILVFDKGEIVQHGSHDELVADESGKYHELWHAQAKYYN